MKEPKFTKGPWNLIETKQEKIVSHWCIQIGEDQIPIFPYKRSYSEDRTQSGLVIDDEKMANATLIAAAPELFHALELADAALSGANMNMDVVRKKVRAALAKALGEHHEK